MQWIGWPPQELQRAAGGEAALSEALLTLAHYEKENALAAADLLERETWALTAILNESQPIWKHLPNPTLRFVPNNPDEHRLELGSFAHLAALSAPSADEQSLIAATAPCWARVSPAQHRRLAGQTGALACSYVAISVAEAIATLGFGLILTRIEVASRIACRVVLAQAQSDRQARLLAVERMLGWAPDPAKVPLERRRPLRARLVLLAVGRGGPAPLVLGAALLGIMMILVCFVMGLY